MTFVGMVRFLFKVKGHLSPRLLAEIINTEKLARKAARERF